MSSKFCTVDQVRAQIGVEDAFTRDDVMIESSIIQATTMIKQHTRRDWEEAEYTDYLDTSDIDISIQRGRGVYINSLREKPINITDLKYPSLRYSASGRWDDVQALDRSVYSVDVRKSQIILYPGVMNYRPRAIRCVYWAGYPFDDTDTDLVLVKDTLTTACILQAAYMVRRELNTTAGTSRDGGENRLKGYWITKSGFVREALALLRTETRILVGGNS